MNGENSQDIFEILHRAAWRKFGGIGKKSRAAPILRGFDDPAKRKGEIL